MEFCGIQTRSIMHLSGIEIKVIEVFCQQCPYQFISGVSFLTKQYVKFVHCTLNRLKLTFVPRATLLHFTCVRACACVCMRACACVCVCGGGGGTKI